MCYPAATLRAIMKFCNSHSIHLISDEVYALSVFTPQAADSEAPQPVGFASVLAVNSHDLIDPDLLHVFYGMSKVFSPTCSSSELMHLGLRRRRCVLRISDLFKCSSS